MLNTKKRVLIAPLDWGLGHATRCILIIREFLNIGTEVIIAANGKTESLLKQEFPNLQFVKLRGYEVSYARKNSFLKICLQIPKIISVIIYEHQWLKRIIKDFQISMAVSDNRYGLWNKKITSIFITHQIRLKLPSLLSFFEPLTYFINLLFINKYNFCWIPDFEKGVNSRQIRGQRGQKNKNSPGGRKKRRI